MNEQEQLKWLDMLCGRMLRQGQEAQLALWRQELEIFANDPAHDRFDEVREIMSDFFSNCTEELSLQTAYDLACVAKDKIDVLKTVEELKRHSDYQNVVDECWAWYERDKKKEQEIEQLKANQSNGWLNYIIGGLCGILFLMIVMHVIAYM